MKQQSINYTINWEEAPFWALAHAYDRDGKGFFYGPFTNSSNSFDSYHESGYSIEESKMEFHKKNWMNSRTLRPINF